MDSSSVYLAKKKMEIPLKPSLTKLNLDNSFAVLNVLSPLDLEQTELTMLLTEPNKNIVGTSVFNIYYENCT